jgi:hypothetical protein
MDLIKARKAEHIKKTKMFPGGGGQLLQFFAFRAVLECNFREKRRMSELEDERRSSVCIVLCPIFTP